MTCMHLRCILRLTSWIALSCALLSSAQQSEVLSNQTIVDLVHNGLGSDVIIKIINEEPNSFSLSSAGVIKLKQQGVPQQVIAAMLSRKTSAPGAPATAPNSNTPSRNLKPNFTWHTQDKTDKMTGKVESVTYVDTPAVTESGERLGDFEAAVNCSKFELDLKITFVADATPGFGFKQNTTTYYVTGGLAGALQAAHNHKKAWTETRVRLDEGDPVIATAEDDYLNISTLYFNRPYDRDDQSGASGLMAFGTMLAANKPVGQISAFLNARRVLLEATFEHGEQAILELHPQDPSFQAKSRSCADLASAPATSSPPSALSTPTYSSLPKSSTALPAPPQVRYMAPAGSSVKISLQEPVTLDSARAGRQIHAQVVQAMQTSAATSAGLPNTHLLTVPVGTEVLLRPRLTSYTGKQITVQLECLYFLWKGTRIPFPATSTPISVSQGNSAAVLNALAPALRVHVPPSSHPEGNTVLLKGKGEQYTMTLSTTATAPSTYQP